MKVSRTRRVESRDEIGFDRQEELLEDARFYPTPYAAHQGWVSLKIAARRTGLR